MEFEQFHLGTTAAADVRDEVPRDRRVVVVCGSGYRSSVSASLLARHGHGRVVNLLGGMRAWEGAGLPLV